MKSNNYSSVIINIFCLLIAIVGMLISLRTCLIAEDANKIARNAYYTAEQANDIAVKANDIAVKANDIAEEGNRILLQDSSSALTVERFTPGYTKVRICQTNDSTYVAHFESAFSVVFGNRGGNQTSLYSISISFLGKDIFSYPDSSLEISDHASKDVAKLPISIEAGDTKYLDFTVKWCSTEKNSLQSVQQECVYAISPVKWTFYSLDQKIPIDTPGLSPNNPYPLPEKCD